MAPLTVSERTRAKLFQLLRDPAFSKSKLASYCHKPASWLSNFLHPNHKRAARPSFHLDELDDIAGYFRISIGELLGAARSGELSGDEQRLLWAFRALAPATQIHFLALLELSSLAPQNKYVLTRSQQHIKAATHPHGVVHESPRVSAADSATAPGENAAAALSALRAHILELAAALGAAAAGSAVDRPLPSASPASPRRSGVAD